MKSRLRHYRVYLASAVSSIMAVFVAVFVITTPVMADNETTIACKDGTSVSIVVGGDANAACKDHGGYGTAAAPAASDSKLTCAILPQAICDAANTGASGTDVKPTGIYLLLRWVLNILTAVVGIAAIGTIIYAGIMYSSAGDDSSMVSKSKVLIRDVAIGIAAYGLMVVALNWLIPGGVIG